MISYITAIACGICGVLAVITIACWVTDTTVIIIPGNRRWKAVVISNHPDDWMETQEQQGTKP